MIRGFAFVRVLGALVVLSGLGAFALLAVKPARAQGGGNRVVTMASGPLDMGAHDVCRCEFYLPAVQRGGGGGGGGAVQVDGFFDVFVDFPTAQGTSGRIKVQFHWDRSSHPGDLIVIEAQQAGDMIEFTVDREPPTLMRLNGLPPGEPWFGRLAPVARFRGLGNNDAHPVGSMRVQSRPNLGSSGQDGVALSFFDIFPE